MRSSRITSLSLGVLACGLALAGCAAEEPGPSGGTGAVSGGGAGGTNNPTSGGTGGMNPTSGGNGGAAGNPTGGSGGMVVAGSGGMTGGMSGGGTGGDVPLTCASDMDIKTGMECAEEAEGWFAIKTVIDVWWVGTPVRDPGRGNIEVYLLGKLEDVCNDGSAGKGTMKACGTVLPPFTSDVACDAFQIEFPNEMWESDKMPRFITTGSTTGFTPGSVLTLDKTLGLIGIELTDATQNDPTGFPDATMTGTFGCDFEDGTTGTGEQCFPDHDGDGHPGVTIRLRTDAADYVGPYDDGTCFGTMAPYKYRGAPTSPDLLAGGGAGGGIRAQYVRIGLRTRLGGSGAIGDDCMSGVGDSQADYLDSRAWECLVDPASLPDGDADHPEMKCTDAEAIFVDENVPAYQVLAKDAVPGETTPPAGWGFLGRDIPKTPSVGPRSSLIRLGSLTDTEPTCDMVRNAAYPAL